MCLALNWSADFSLRSLEEIMSSTYKLRPATHDDYDFLYNLHVAAIRPSVEATYGWDDAFQAEYFRSRWDPANRQIICVNNLDIGVLKLEQPHPGTIFLALIEVHPDYQGQGIGTAVIRDVMAGAHQRGLEVELNVLKTNPKAKRLYERLGFVITEEWEDRYVMVATAPD